MKKCWCGNCHFEEYSDGYFFCDVCDTLVTKADCTVVTQNVNDEDDFYGKNYWEQLMLERAELANCSDMIDLYLGTRAAYWLHVLHRFVLPGDVEVAEIGCGLGQLTYLLKCSGYRETGFDLSPSICEYIRRELSIHVVNSTFRKCDKKYSAIVAMDLIEHLEDPLSCIQDIADSLTDDGVVMLQTPCFDKTVSYQELVDANAASLKLFSPTEHLFLFSKKSMASMLKSKGFTDIRFLDAYFGNDYDMFVVASKQPLKEHTDDEIRRCLYSQPYGRVIQALISAADKAKKGIEDTEALRLNRDGILLQLKALTEEKNAVEANRDDLLSQLQALAEEKNAVEANRDNLLSQLQALAEEKTAVEANRDDLLSQLQALAEEKTAVEANRDGILSQLYSLIDKIKAVEENRDSLLVQLQSVTGAAHPTESQPE